MSTTVQHIDPNDIVIDQAITIRPINDEVVEDYANAMETGWGTFPPIRAMVVDGKPHVCDGQHRVMAARKAGVGAVPCLIDAGTLEEAKLVAASGNKAHGFRRSYADKRAAVMVVLKSPEAKDWSHRQIAEWVGVSNTFVSEMAKRMKAPPTVSADSAAQAEPQEPSEEPDQEPEADRHDRADAAATVNADSAKPAKDSRGVEIPPSLEPAFATGSQMGAVLGDINSVEDRLDELATQPGGEGLGLHDGAQYRQPFKTLREIIKHQRPHAVCIVCDGVGCKTCGKRGWLTKTVTELAEQHQAGKKGGAR